MTNLADKWAAEAARYDGYATGSPHPEMHKAIAKTLRGCAEELRLQEALDDGVFV